MRGTSQASLTAVQEKYAPVLEAAGQDALTIGEQLFTVVDALDGSGALRRSLADPSRTSDDKIVLIRSILANGFDPRVVSIMEALVSERWSADRDLSDAVSLLAIDAYLAAAQAEDQLETVESELFAITRALSGQREVRQILSDPSSKAEDRVALLVKLIVGKAHPVTVALASRATAAPRGERFVPALGRVSDLAAARRARMVAYVSVSHALNATQLERLEAALEAHYGQQMQLNVTVDPAVVGGLRIQVGADVVDSTVLTRLLDARRRLAS